MIELALKAPSRNLVAITGLSRSGKSMLAPIVSSLERADILKMDYTLEQYPVLNHLGLMSDRVTIYLMRYMVNFIIYNSQIGRNSNFRFSDWTSIWNTSDPRDYIKRLANEEGDSIFNKIKEKKLLNIFMFHNALWHAEIFFKAFPDLIMIHIDRHPIDLIHSWFRRNYGSNFYDKDRSALTLINNKNNKIPYYANSWGEEYNRLSEMDRIIKMVYTINRNHYRTLEKLPENNQNQIIVINFDKMVTNPNFDIDRICSLLNTAQTSYTLSVMERERCPRKIDKIKRNVKFDEIKKISMTESLELLKEMVEDYETKTSISA